MQQLRKGLYEIIDKPTEVTYKFTDSTKKEIVQHRNNLLPYYPKEYAQRKLTQLYSITGLKIVRNNTQTEQNQTVYDKNSQKQIQQQTVAPQIANTPEQKYLKKKEK